MSDEVINLCWKPKASDLQAWTHQRKGTHLVALVCVCHLCHHLRMPAQDPPVNRRQRVIRRRCCWVVVRQVAQQVPQRASQFPVRL